MYEGLGTQAPATTGMVARQFHRLNLTTTGTTDRQAIYLGLGTQAEAGDDGNCWPTKAIL